MSSIDLAGNWLLRDDTGKHNTSMQVPGDAISALHSADLIPDPYWGRNEYDLRWISERDWTLSRTVDLGSTDFQLVLGELDTVAKVLVNGQQVLDADNAFRRYRVDVSSALRVGANELEIQFRSPIHAANEEQAKQPFFVPFHTQNNPLFNGNMLRKQQCDFGWDWNIALAPFGLYGDIRLEPNTALQIKDVGITQTHNKASVEVIVLVKLADAVEAITPFAIGLGDTKASGLIMSGTQTVSATLTIENPDLWWPAGLGDQPLHQLTIEVGSEVETRRIGLRSMDLISEPDDVGRSFKLHVNGQDVFARGANWIPADALAGRITRDAVRDLLESAVAANMNMIRVWGGGRYEPDWFYDMCDELGLMVWQDFMFACNLYPCTDDFLENAAKEVRDVVSRLHHHACLALWCGDNEVLGALTWFEESVKDRDRYLVAYDRLNRSIETNLKATDSQANWWPSSPSPGPLSFGDAWHDDSSGDMHFWSVWHEGRDFDHYRDVAPRFCSEFGFQSYPSMPVIKHFAGPEDFNIASPVMESHQKNKGGNARIAETMFRYFRFPVDFESFVYLSQVQQGMAIKTAVTHWRTLKPHCMGTLIWQLNDSWPVCSWSSLNHGGSWKLLHHMARHFYAPVMATLVPDGDQLLVKAVNDTRDPVKLAIEVLALSLAGRMRQLAMSSVEVPTDSAVNPLVLEHAALMHDELVLLRWASESGQGGSDLHAPKPFKAYNLKPSGLTFSTQQDGDQTVLTFKSTAAAFFVAVEADVPGRFTDNGFHVLLDEPVTIRFTPQEAGMQPGFTCHDLHSATYSTVPGSNASHSKIRPSLATQPTNEIAK